jgi:hypothetical protein
MISKMRDLLTIYVTTPAAYLGEYASRPITSVKRVGVGYYHYHGKQYTRHNGFLYTLVAGFPTKREVTAYIAALPDRQDACVVLRGIPDRRVPVPHLVPGYSVWREPYTKKSLAIRRRRTSTTTG